MNDSDWLIALCVICYALCKSLCSLLYFGSLWRLNWENWEGLVTEMDEDSDKEQPRSEKMAAFTKVMQVSKGVNNITRLFTNLSLTSNIITSPRHVFLRRFALCHSRSVNILLYSFYSLFILFCSLRSICIFFCNL